MATTIGNVHLHYRPLKEVEDEVAVDGIIVDDGEDEEEDVVGTACSPRSTSACYFDPVGIKRAYT